jgi:hypothetical protein
MVQQRLEKHHHIQRMPRTGRLVQPDQSPEQALFGTLQQLLHLCCGQTQFGGQVIYFSYHRFSRYQRKTNTPTRQGS